MVQLQDNLKAIEATGGQVGELLVAARRKDSTWYLGGMAAGAPRDVRLPLLFLSPGKYTARIWKDASDGNASPNHPSTETVTPSSADTLRLRLALDGQVSRNEEVRSTISALRPSAAEIP